MPTDTFRIVHSTLIEHYQFIEAHLESVYSNLSEKSYLEGLEDVKKASLPAIIRAIQKMEKEKGVSVFTAEEYNALSHIFQRRNFWCHNCFYDLTFDSKTEKLKNPEDMHRMMADLREAEKWRKILFERQRPN